MIKPLGTADTAEREPSTWPTSSPALAAKHEVAAAFQRTARVENTRAAVGAWCDRRGALPCPPQA